MATGPYQDEARELRELEDDERRIEAALAGAAAPEVRAQLDAGRRWIAERRRALVRRPVSCAALLQAGPAQLAVRVRDLSAAGAGLELDAPPPVGARVRLSFPALANAPALDAVVRHGSADTRRAGVEFVGGGEIAAAIVAAVLQAVGAG